VKGINSVSLYVLTLLEAIRMNYDLTREKRLYNKILKNTIRALHTIGWVEIS